MILWQQKNGPNFSVDLHQLKSKLHSIRQLQAKLLGEVRALPSGMDKEAELDALLQSAIKTSAIEGEQLNVESVRSSVARHLDMSVARHLDMSRIDLPEAGKHEAAIVDMLSTAVSKSISNPTA